MSQYYPQHLPPMYQPSAAPMPRHPALHDIPQDTYTHSTALTDLFNLLANITPEERASILKDEGFNQRLNEFSQKFILWLLQGKLGNVFLESLPARQEQAEGLLLLARGIYAENKNQTQAEVARLAQENKELKEKLASL